MAQNFSDESKIRAWLLDNRLSNAVKSFFEIEEAGFFKREQWYSLEKYLTIQGFKDIWAIRAGKEIYNLLVQMKDTK